ncbi:ribokinase [Agromyces intestinalis]|uniref:ribokinase n=1 Tax=Agromyces intestinalis TaxID=2592652 RepID=UPI00143D6B53|nr:ribokinase [Agromyces intestinalis]
MTPSFQGEVGHSTEGRMNRIVVVGSLNLDIVLGVRVLPRPGETVAADRLLTAGGGKGANQAYAAARLTGEPGRVSMVGCIGDDDAGARLASELEHVGVDIAHLARVPASTGHASIAVQADGENTVAVFAGANEAWPDGHAGATPIRKGDVLVVQQEIPAAVVAEALSVARRVGARTVLNAAPARESARDLLADVDVLVVNALELAALVDAGTATARSQTQPVESMLAALDYDGDVVVTIGAAGALVRPRAAAPVRVPAHPVVAIDTVGAGDAFVGALAGQLADGADLFEAVAVANAAGGLTATVRGARHPGLDSAAVARVVRSIP